MTKKQVIREAGPIPACAGQPRARNPTGKIERAYPRLRGATASAAAAACRYTGLSPLARGNLIEATR